jgi:squalene cyclase
MNRRLFLIVSACVVFALPALAQSPGVPRDRDPALRAKVGAAIEKGLGFLEKQQKPDGSWASENGRWMEKDPNLVTTYCLLALAYVHEQL